MKDLKRIGQGVLWIGAGFLWASPLFGQSQDSEKPKPAAHDYSLLLDSPVNGEVIDQAAPTIQPDNRPLSGIQNPTVGTAEMRHSYWVPGITYSNGLRSNGSNAATSSGWNTTSFVSTDVSLLQGWSHSTLSANYSGGGYFSTDKVQGNGQYQQLAATYQIDQRRWQMLFMDQFSLLPESSFGFGGTTGLSTPGIGGSLNAPQAGLQSNYLPNQSIFAGTGSRYSNSAAVQFSYQLSTRGVVTLGGTYGMLRFANPGGASNDS